MTFGRLIYRPDWSPDGRYLAFGADDDDNRTITLLVIDVTNGEVRRLIEEGHGPAWNPDGQRIIYKPAGDRQILFVADVKRPDAYAVDRFGF